MPVIETIRRWHQIGEIRAWPFWLDDWAIGAFLLYGAWQTRKDFAHGRGMLAAAWAFACGMGYSSFFSALVAVGEPDPSGVRSSIVVAIKGVMFALAITALVVTLRWRPSKSSCPSAV